MRRPGVRIPSPPPMWEAPLDLPDAGRAGLPPFADRGRAGATGVRSGGAEPVGELVEGRLEAPYVDLGQPERLADVALGVVQHRREGRSLVGERDGDGAAVRGRAVQG